MAIKIAFKTRFGDDYVEAYTRILSIKINYVVNHADVEIGIYRSELDRTLGMEPVSVESRRISGDNFKEFFKELSLDKIDTTISPVADIYNLLTKEVGGKYEKGIKLYDEKEIGDGGRKEVGKEEIIEDVKAAEKQAALDKVAK